MSDVVPTNIFHYKEQHPVLMES